MATWFDVSSGFVEKRRSDQQELARRARLPYMTIYRLENGIAPDAAHGYAVKLARTLGISLDVLCGMYEEEKDTSELCPPRSPRLNGKMIAAVEHFTCAVDAAPVGKVYKMIGSPVPHSPLHGRGPLACESEVIHGEAYYRGPAAT